MKKIVELYGKFNAFTPTKRLVIVAILFIAFVIGLSTKFGFDAITRFFLMLPLLVFAFSRFVYKMSLMK